MNTTDYSKGYEAAKERYLKMIQEMEEEIIWLKRKKTTITSLFKANVTWQRKQRKNLEERLKKYES